MRKSHHCSRFLSAFALIPLVRLAVMALALLAVSDLQAQSTYYWDNNGGTAGFGTAGGTWAAPTTNNSTQGWSTNSAGGTLPSGTTTTTTSDALNFGTSSAGLATGTITNSGTVEANTLTFGSASGTITFTNGTITLGGSAPAISNTATVNMGSALAGSNGLTKNGAGQLTLTVSNTYTGMTTVNAGILRLQGGSTANLINGDVTVSGGALNFATGNQLADTASITLNSGSVDFSTFNETISSIAMSGGTLRRSGGTFALTNAASFTGGTVNMVSGTGRINTAGTTTLGSATFSYSNAASSTTGLFLGGNIAVNASTTANFTNSAAGVGRIDLNGANRTIDVGSGAAMNVGWAIVGTNGITKNGQGALVLSASNTYSGSTAVSAGSLIVNGNQSAASGILTVSSGATLGGSGTIGGATTISGILAPGNSIGTLTVANDVTWNSGNNWVFELGAAGPTIGSPGTSDLLAITGVNDFLKGTGAAGSFSFDFAGTGDIGWYKLVDWAGGTTTFATNDFAGVNLGGGFTSEFAIQDNALYVNVVPEPSTYALLAVAAAGLGIHVVRRRRGSRH